MEGFVSYEVGAGREVLFVFRAQQRPPVGASLLAMDSRAPRLASHYALALTTIASTLAPTENYIRLRRGFRLLAGCQRQSILAIGIVEVLRLQRQAHVLTL